MFKALVKSRFQSYFAQFNFGAGQRSGGLSSTGQTVLIVACMVGVLIGFGTLIINFFSPMATPFNEGGIAWLYFTFACLIALALMFLGSVFTAKSQLFEANDNELLLSMPIPPRLILLSRMLVLLVINYVFELIVMVPAIYVWISQGLPLTALGVVAFVLTVLTLPLLALALSALVGWLVSLLTSRMRKKNLMTIVFSVAFLAIYFIFFSQINQYITALVSNAQSIAGSMAGFAPLYWVGNCIAEPNLTHLLFSLLIYIVPFVIMVWVLARSFIKLITTKRGAKKIKYVAGEMKVMSPRRALLRREFSRLGSSSVYIMNCGMGVLFVFAAGAAMLIFSGEISKLVSESETIRLLGVLAPLVLCLISAMCDFSAASVSMDGKTIWVLRSLPVETKSILNAKLSVHRIIVGLTLLFSTVVAVFLLKADVFTSIGMILMPLLFTELNADIGLMANLKYPHLDWINETQAVKQGFGVLISMFAGFAIAMLFGGLSVLLMQAGLPTVVCVYIVNVLLLGGIFLCHRWINGRGVAIYEGLS